MAGDPNSVSVPVTYGANTSPPGGAGGAQQSQVQSLVNPQPSMITDLSGQAAAANAPSMNWNLPKASDWGSLKPDPSFAPKATGFLGGGPLYDQTSAADPTASPFSKWVANNSLQTSADEMYEPLTRLGNGFDRAMSFFSKQDPGAPSMDAYARAGQTFQDPRARAIIMSDRSLFDAANAHPIEFAAQLQQQLDMADKAHPTTTTMTNKPIPPEHQQAVHVKATNAGVPNDAAFAMHAPQLHTEDEFVNAIKGLSWNQMGRLWGMQHWINPAQQASMSLMGQQQQRADAATQQYEKLLSSGGASKDDLDKAYEAMQREKGGMIDLQMRFSSPQTYAYPQMQNPAEQVQ